MDPSDARMRSVARGTPRVLRMRRCLASMPRTRQVGIRHIRLWSQDVDVLSIPPDFGAIFIQRSGATGMSVSIDFSERGGDDDAVARGALDTWISAPVVHRMKRLSVTSAGKFTLGKLCELKGVMSALEDVDIYVDPMAIQEGDDIGLVTFSLPLARLRRLVVENCFLVDMMSEASVNLSELSISMDEGIVHSTAKVPDLPPLREFLRYLSLLRGLRKLSLYEIFPPYDEKDITCDVRVDLPCGFKRLEFVAAKCDGSVASDLTRRCLETWARLEVPAAADQLIVVGEDEALTHTGAAGIRLSSCTTRLFAAVAPSDRVITALTELSLSDGGVRATYTTGTSDNARVSTSTRTFQSSIVRGLYTANDLADVRTPVIERDVLCLGSLHSLSVSVTSDEVRQRLFSPSAGSSVPELALKDAVNVRVFECPYVEIVNTAAKLAAMTSDGIAFAYFPRLDTLCLTGSVFGLDAGEVELANTALTELVHARKAGGAQIRSLRVDMCLAVQKTLGVWRRLGDCMEVVYV